MIDAYVAEAKSKESMMLKLYNDVLKLAAIEKCASKQYAGAYEKGSREIQKAGAKNRLVAEKSSAGKYWQLYERCFSGDHLSFLSMSDV